ncbi:MAG: transposase [Clostridiales bacterium]|nr:transposase [Clostridiales bacterium]
MLAEIATVEERLQLIKECYQSGLTVNEWCRQNGICRNTFHTWTTRLRKKGLLETAAMVPKVLKPEAGAPEIVKVEISAENCRIPATYEGEDLQRAGKEARAAAGAVMEIDLGEVQIKVTNQVDPALLAKTIRLLGGDPGC